MAAKFVCIIAALIAAAAGEAEPGYGYPAARGYSYGYGFNAGAGYRGYGLGPYRSGYGKRSAEAEPSWIGSGSYQSVSRVTPYGGVISYGVKTNGPYASVSEDRLSPIGYPVAKPYLGYGKRSAEAEPEAGILGIRRPYVYGPGIAAHPYGATSYEYRSPQGIGKRSAEAEPEPSYYAPYGARSYQSVTRVTPYGGISSYGVATNGYAASVSENRLSPYGYGKRSAEAEPSYYGPYGGSRSYQSVTRVTPYGGISSYGVRTNGYAASVSENRLSPYGYGKRSAEAEPSYYGPYGGSRSYQSVTRVTPYGGISSYGVRTNGYAASVSENRLSPYGYGKRSAEAEPSYYAPYGLRRPYGYGPAIAAHPYGGSSYVYRSPQGL